MRKLKITISKEIVIADLIGFMHVLKFILVVLNARYDVNILLILDINISI